MPSEWGSSPSAVRATRRADGPGARARRRRTLTADDLRLALPHVIENDRNVAAARKAIEAQWLPALENFKPELIFIFAGFDAHREDLLGGMALIEADYAWITRELMTLAARHSQGRIVSMLKGGYNLSALGRSAVAHVKSLAQH